MLLVVAILILCESKSGNAMAKFWVDDTKEPIRNVRRRCRFCKSLYTDYNYSEFCNACLTAHKICLEERRMQRAVEGRSEQVVIPAPRITKKCSQCEQPVENAAEKNCLACQTKLDGIKQRKAKEAAAAKTEAERPKDRFELIELD